MSEGERRDPDPRSGLDEQGRWRPAFESQREPFRPGDDPRRVPHLRPGHELSMRHGAYSERRVGEVKATILEQLNASAPVYDPADDHARDLLAGNLARIRLVELYVEEHGLLDENGELRPVLRDLPRWQESATRQLRELGLTTLSRAELGLDIARARHLVSADEVNELLRRAAAPFIPRAQRAAFLAELERVSLELGMGEGEGEGVDA